MGVRIYKCGVCGEILLEICGNSNTLKCCGESMQNLVAKSKDEAREKHVPVVDKNRCCVKVKIGEVEHPMTAEHYIEWILLETNKGFQLKYLDKFSDPEAKFELSKGEEIRCVYAYCNIHGLWRS